MKTITLALAGLAGATLLIGGAAATGGPHEAGGPCDVVDDCNPGLVCSATYNPGREGVCLDATGATSMTDIIQAELDAIPPPPAYGMGEAYKFPPGVILLEDPDGDGTALTIGTRIRLEGNGAVLVPGEGVTALDFRVDIQGNPDPKTHADYASARDLTIRPPDAGSPRAGRGIFVRAHGVRLDNIRVMALGTGIEIWGPGDIHNANHFRLTNITVSGCIDNGVYVHGADANGGLFSGVEVKGGAGIWESSFLGNTWIMPSVAGTVGYSFRHDGGTNASVIVGGYYEEGDPHIQADIGASLWVGGNIVRDVPERVDRLGYNRSRLVFRHSLGKNGMQITLPWDDEVAMLLQARPQEQTGWKLGIWGNEWGIWPEASNDKTRAPIRWQTSNVPTFGFYRLGTPMP